MASGEETLVHEILSGNVNSYALLVKRYQKPIYNLMLRMTGSEQDAFDLTQEAFVKAYEKLEKFNPSAPFFPWLYTIGLNLPGISFEEPGGPQSTPMNPKTAFL